MLGSVETGWFPSAAEKEKARLLVAHIANQATRTMDSIIGEVLRSDARQARTYADSDYIQRNHELDSLDEVQSQFEQRYGVPALKTQTLETIKEVGRLEADEDKASIHLGVLERDFSPEDVRVAAARSELEEARSARSRYNYTSAIGPGLDTLPEVARKYAEILQKQAALEPIVSFLRQERDQQDIFAKRVRSVITIVDTAKNPDRPTSPLRVPMIELGTIVGIVFSIFYVGGMSFLASWKETIVTRSLAWNSVQTPE